SRRRHTRFSRDWSSDVCSSDLWNSTIKLILFPSISRFIFLIQFGCNPFLGNNSRYWNPHNYSGRNKLSLGFHGRNLRKYLKRHRSEERRVGKSVDLGRRSMWTG